MPSFITDRTSGECAYITNPDELRHFKIKRINLGESVSLINGTGSLFLTVFEYIDKKEARFSILKEEKMPYRVPQTFYIGFTDNKKMEFIAEKAGEMGIKAFAFFCGDKTEKHAKIPNEEKIRKKVISGMKQSDNPNMPEYLGVFKCLKNIDMTTGTITLSPKAPQSLVDINDKKRAKEVIIGPREGFSDREMLYLASKKIRFFSLSSVIYRVETAFIIASFLLGK